MKPSRPQWTCILFLALAVVAPSVSLAQESSAAPAGSQAINLSLMDCIREAFKNNKEIRIAAYGQELRDGDIQFQRAQFDANLETDASAGDFSIPRLSEDPFTTTRFVASTHSSDTRVVSTYTDRLHIGSTWSAALTLDRGGNLSGVGLGGATFSPPASIEYRPRLDLGFKQQLLRNFGRKVNDTQILVANLNKAIDAQAFKTQVLTTLSGVEGGYWTLVFALQNLQVKQEALRLAQELLKLNQIKVQVGTLPPIDITQAEAGVASREEDVIVAEADIQNAEDALRRVIGMDPKSPIWRSRIVPTEDLTPPELDVDLDRETTTAMENRPDLESARLNLKTADAQLYFQRNQLKYSLEADAQYSLSGDAGNVPADFRSNTVEGFGDSLGFIPRRDFPTYQVAVKLGIPIGNRAAEAQYSSVRLTREQSEVTYQNLEQKAIVEVGLAVRRVLTDRKKISAAEKNRILQEKKVEAEQKKFENGMSTSFQVLTFQNDLATARSAEIQGKTDYRVSLANLRKVTGMLDKTLNVNVAKP